MQVEDRSVSAKIVSSSSESPSCGLNVVFESSSISVHELDSAITASSSLSHEIDVSQTGSVERISEVETVATTAANSSFSSGCSFSETLPSKNMTGEFGLFANYHLHNMIQTYELTQRIGQLSRQNSINQ